MVGCEIKNEYENNVLWKEIGLRAPKLLSILSSIVNVKGGGLCDHILRKKISTLIMNKILTRAPKFIWKMSMGPS